MFQKWEVWQFKETCLFDKSLLTWKESNISCFFFLHFHKVEHIIREDYLVEAMEMLELYCDLLLARFGLIETQQWAKFYLSLSVLDHSNLIIFRNIYSRLLIATHFFKIRSHIKLISFHFSRSQVPAIIFRVPAILFNTCT